MKKKKGFLIIFSIIVFVAICSIVYTNYKSNITVIINHNIKAAAKTDQFLYLNKITPFDWDQAFIIEDPYIGGEALDKIVGVKCNLKRSDVDSTRRIVFIKEKKLVYDYSYNWTAVSFIPLGTVVNKENCKYNIQKSNSKQLVLKLSEENINDSK